MDQHPKQPQMLSKGVSIPATQLTAQDWNNRVNRIGGCLNKASWSSWLQKQNASDVGGVGVVRPPTATTRQMGGLNNTSTTSAPHTTANTSTANVRRRPQSAGGSIHSLRQQKQQHGTNRRMDRSTIDLAVNSLLLSEVTMPPSPPNNIHITTDSAYVDKNDAYTPLPSFSASAVNGPLQLSADHLVALNTLLVCVRGLCKTDATDHDTASPKVPKSLFETLLTTLRGTSNSVDAYFVDHAVCAVAVLEAAASTLDNHPVLGPLLEGLYTFVSRGIMVSANPIANGTTFRGCRHFSPDLLASAVVSRFQNYVQHSGTFAKRRVEKSDEKLNEEQNAVAMAMNRSRLNKRSLTSHFKVWRSYTRTLKQIRKIATDQTQKHLSMKRTTLYAWRLEVLQGKILKSRLDTATMRQELQATKNDLTNAFQQIRVLEESAKAAETRINTLQQALQRTDSELANATSPMLFDFRKPLLDVTSKKEVTRGIVHFCRSDVYEQGQEAGCGGIWMGDFGCPHAPQGIAAPGMDLVKSHYVIRVLMPDSDGSQSPTSTPSFREAGGGGGARLRQSQEDERRIIKWVNTTLTKTCSAIVHAVEQGGHGNRLMSRLAESFPAVKSHRLYVAGKVADTKRWLKIAASMKVMRDSNLCLTEGPSQPPYHITSVTQLAGNPLLYALLLPLPSLTSIVEQLRTPHQHGGSGAVSRTHSNRHHHDQQYISIPDVLTMEALFKEFTRLGVTLHVSEEEFCTAHRHGTDSHDALTHQNNDGTADNRIEGAPDDVGQDGGGTVNDMLVSDAHSLLLTRLGALEQMGNAIDGLECTRAVLDASQHSHNTAAEAPAIVSTTTDDSQLLDSGNDTYTSTTLQVGPSGVRRNRTEHILPACIIPRGGGWGVGGGAHQDSDEEMFGTVLKWVRGVLQRYSTLQAAATNVSHSSALDHHPLHKYHLRKKSSISSHHINTAAPIRHPLAGDHDTDSFLLSNTAATTIHPLLNVSNFTDDFGSGLEIFAIIIQTLRPPSCPTGLSDLVELVSCAAHQSVASEYLCRVAVQELGCSLSDHVVDTLHTATPEVRALMCTSLYNACRATSRFTPIVSIENAVSPGARGRSKSPRPNSAGGRPSSGRGASPPGAAPGRLGVSRVSASGVGGASSSLFSTGTNNGASTHALEASILIQPQLSAVDIGNELFKHSSSSPPPLVPSMMLPTGRLESLFLHDDQRGAGGGGSPTKHDNNNTSPAGPGTRLLEKTWVLLYGVFSGLATVCPPIILLPLDAAYRRPQQQHHHLPAHSQGRAGCVVSPHSVPLADSMDRNHYSHTAGVMWGPETALEFDRILGPTTCDFWYQRQDPHQKSRPSQVESRLQPPTGMNVDDFLQATFLSNSTGGSPPIASPRGTSPLQEVLREVQLLRAFRDCCMSAMSGADIWKLSTRLSGRFVSGPTRMSSVASAVIASRRMGSSTSVKKTGMTLSPKNTVNEATGSEDVSEFSGSLSRPASASLRRGSNSLRSPTNGAGDQQDSGGVLDAAVAIREELRASTSDLRIVSSQFPEFIVRYTIYMRDIASPCTSRKVETWQGRNQESVDTWLTQVFLPSARASMLLRSTTRGLDPHNAAGTTPSTLLPQPQPFTILPSSEAGGSSIALSAFIDVSGGHSRSGHTSVEEAALATIKGSDTALDSPGTILTLPFSDLAKGRSWGLEGVPVAVDSLLRHSTLARLYTLYSSWHTNDRWFQLEKRILTAEGFLRLCCDIGWVGTRTMNNAVVDDNFGAPKPPFPISHNADVGIQSSVSFRRAPPPSFLRRRTSLGGDPTSALKNQHAPRRSSKLRIKQAVTQQDRNRSFTQGVGGPSTSADADQWDISSTDLEGSMRGEPQFSDVNNMLACAPSHGHNNSCNLHSETGREKLLAHTAMTLFFHVAAMRESTTAALEYAHQTECSVSPAVPRSKSIASVMSASVQSNLQPGSSTNTKRNLSIMGGGTVAPATVSSSAVHPDDIRYSLPSHIFSGYAKDCMLANGQQQHGGGGGSVDPRELMSHPPRSASLTYSGFLECIYNLALAAFPYPWMLPSYRLHYLLKDVLERGVEIVPAAFGIRIPADH